MYSARKIRRLRVLAGLVPVLVFATPGTAQACPKCLLSAADRVFAPVELWVVLGVILLVLQYRCSRTWCRRAQISIAVFLLAATFWTHLHRSRLDFLKRWTRSGPTDSAMASLVEDESATLAELAFVVERGPWREASAAVLRLVRDPSVDLKSLEATFVRRLSVEPDAHAMPEVRLATEALMRASGSASHTSTAAPH